MAGLDGKKIALIATDGFEDSELTKPKEAVEEAGATVTVISDHDGEIKGKDDTSVSVNSTLDSVNADDFDGLLIPGGVKNPDVMRTNEKGVSFVRDFFEQHKPVAAICHGPWLLVEADVLKGRRVTSWPSLKTDIKNAGGDWTDEEVVTDQGLVTSRKPDDLEAFCAKAVEEFAEGEHEGQAT
jgi:protease I